MSSIVEPMTSSASDLGVVKVAPKGVSGLRYADRFVKLYQDRLEILDYFYPTSTSKEIPLQDIEQIQTFKELKFTWYDLRYWGYTYWNGIWWARDDNRDPEFVGDHHPKYETVIITLKDDTMRKGFSVEDGELFLSTLRMLVNTQSI
eukprot:TRINITY_DN64564_c0_g1_i1.p1 TRINITY_DN64564_c0_g1~~TRINITY_DN64564_c0_g1_i1.p1  ORF type:complete len:147 (+),score=18.83 TRINITY_DN64564_c0_g1_i1:121-561(+)